MYKDENGYPVLLSKFITDNNFLTSPTLDITTVLDHGVNFVAQNAYFRIPFIDVTNNGVIIVGSDIRHDTASDYTMTDTGIIRSLDGGSTWGSDQMLFLNNGIAAKSRKHNPSILIDKNTNRVFIFVFVIDSYTDEANTGLVLDPPIIWDFVYKYSDDDGATWSDEISLKALLTDLTANYYLSGSSTKGITLSDGTLIMPIYDGRQSNDLSEPGTDFQFRSGFIYSTDHGATWIKSTMVLAPTNECSVIDLQDGRLLLVCREYGNNKRIFITEDMGVSWTPYIGDKYLAGYVCQISTHRFISGSKSRSLICFPTDLEARSNGKIFITNYFRRFREFLLVESGIYNGYTCFAQNGDKLYMVLEKDGDILFYDLNDYVQYLI